MHYVLKPTLRSLKKSLASFSGHVRTSPYIMLSKKISGSGLLNAAAGIDRGRVGERLRAALAGLQELHFLKEKQRNMVFWALRMDREEPVSSNDPCKENPDVETEEQRLEATLTALKQQLSRLRRQDVGLKSHLQQLDQQISELKLDVCKVSSEHLETDSRPSSGFYDLSDGGVPPSLGRRERRPGESPRGGVRLGSSWIRTGTGGADRARQRPVSTGDLERILTLVPSVEGKKPSPCHNLRHSTVDPKYQSNLVSRGGTEVYRYPSPLHAVALQSPIFSLSGDGATPAARETAGAQGGAAPASDCLQARGEGAEVRQASYINKLLQRSLSKTSLQGEGAEIGPSLPAGVTRKPLLSSPGSQESPAAKHLGPKTRACISALWRWGRTPSQWKAREAAHTSDQSSWVEEEDGKSSCPDQSSREQLRGAALARKLSDKRPRLGRSASKEEGRGQDRPPVSGAQPEFVHAQFVPAGSQRVKVRQADRKTKAVRLRKRSCDKPRVTKQPQAPSEMGREAGAGLDRGPKQAGPARASRKLTLSRGREAAGPAQRPASMAPPSLTTPPSSRPNWTRLSGPERPTGHRARTSR
ncbi:hypothetical protein ANANG_G00303070 [Anguilla anguilla]|uniref:Uncharacterized protein n=1 Tax=Anguilla anguilla TaxID=7936 RepID=A0A9D3RID1_ANGAN|nr:hypothetical protein ANANG_G00303070 [Anguilla anguilla]